MDQARTKQRLWSILQQGHSGYVLYHTVHVCCFAGEETRVLYTLYVCICPEGQLKTSQEQEQSTAKIQPLLGQKTENNP